MQFLNCTFEAMLLAHMAQVSASLRCLHTLTHDCLLYVMTAACVLNLFPRTSRHTLQVLHLLTEDEQAALLECFRHVAAQLPVAAHAVRRSMAAQRLPCLDLAGTAILHDPGALAGCLVLGAGQDDELLGSSDERYMRVAGGALAAHLGLPFTGLFVKFSCSRAAWRHSPPCPPRLAAAQCPTCSKACPTTCKASIALKSCYVPWSSECVGTLKLPGLTRFCICMLCAAQAASCGS
jgi:hypothetical protein